jgi:tripartite-type tricarboxylate transporter receptor subunit TctC
MMWRLIETAGISACSASRGAKKTVRKGAAMKTRILLAVFSVVLTLIAPEEMFAQGAFPTKPIQMLIGYAPGGSTDVLVRTLAQESKKFLGQDIVVVNKTGSAGSVAALQVTAAKPDGYTLGVSPSSTFTVNPFLQDLQVDLVKESTAILSFAIFNVAIFVKPDSPFTTLKEAVEYARRNPGKLTYGNPGVGTRPYLVMAAIAAHEQVKINFVPFPGDTPTVTALLGGHIMTAGCSAGGWVPQMDAGGLRLLAVCEEDRIEAYPKIPTVLELGYPYPFPLVVFVHGPKNIPEPIRKKLEDALEKASQTPTFKEVATKNALYAKKHMFHEELTNFLVSERTKTGEVIQKLGLAKK